MPFAQYKQPSIALSLLKAELAERSVGARVLYPNLRFAERVGADTYERIASWYPTDLLGDWLFARDLCGCDGDDEGYLEQVLRGRDPAHTQAYFGKRPLDRREWQDLLAVRAAVPEFLEDCAREVVGGRPGDRRVHQPVPPAHRGPGAGPAAQGRPAGAVRGRRRRQFPGPHGAGGGAAVPLA